MEQTPGKILSTWSKGSTAHSSKVEEETGTQRYLGLGGL